MKILVKEEEEDLCGIYQIKNTTNNKIYVGSTATSFKIRLQQHLYLLNLDKHHSRYLQNSYNKYKNDSFEFSILEICKKEVVVEKEQTWLDKLKPYNRSIGYNVLVKAHNSSGYKHTEESLKLIGELSKARGCHPNSRLAMIKANTGRKREKEHGERMSKIHSEAVIQLSLNGKFIKEWSSQTLAGKTLGIKTISNISGCCLGKCKSCGGYIWVYKKQYDSKKKYEYLPKRNGVKL